MTSTPSIPTSTLFPRPSCHTCPPSSRESLRKKEDAEERLGVQAVGVEVPQQLRICDLHHRMKPRPSFITQPPLSSSSSFGQKLLCKTSSMPGVCSFLFSTAHI
ncbi:hypothetical protein FQA47_018621 [Oryzias melastigma]|uniref:Uncharacterized protein n=1 Tax=Oryzias melastigma TaxID=30732 RepID=A0A834BYL9_ORYME|nr:hypothetical protein FQA47_018621 [Oryzias melastigma]